MPEPGEASGDPGAKTAALKNAILARGIALESVDDLDGALGTSSGGCIQLLNPGYSDTGVVADSLGFMSLLLYSGAIVSIRDATGDPARSVRELREFICGWVSSRRVNS